ncbi:hypothetical protein [uncultured Polaribacter sp.]|uniref:hypothetical protein n=1 Tax=uncultured Polaribacter sp. TaxID=174711 RepID=UPI00261AB3E2|nr:hypothetical protein [uncultured Polaribacter sp.]
MKFTSIIMLVLLFGQQVYAQTCCSGGVPLSNNLGLSNEGKGSLQLGINYDYNNLNTLNAGSERLNDNSRQRITNSILANIGYSFTAKFSVETLFTWVNQTRTITQFNNENFTETKGIGDAVILLKYTFPNLFKNNTALNIGLGSKIPLGKSDIVSNQGIQLTADLQPGSGAFDGIGWLSLAKQLSFRPTATFSSSVTYRFTGVNNSYLNNTSTYKFGNVLQANISYVDEFLVHKTLINPGLVIKYRKSTVDKINNSIIPNTGGEWLFARAELTIQLSQNLSFTNKFEVPLYSYVDGTQLTPTSRFTTGFTYKIFKKQPLITNIK